MARKKKSREKPPVPDGHDRRSLQAEKDKEIRTGQAAAPDGVSGRWE